MLSSSLETPGRTHWPLGLANPVLPVLGHVDAACEALLEAIRDAGYRPLLCASPGDAASLARARGSEFVIVQSSSIATSPLRMLETLRTLGPLRVILAGPTQGSLTCSLALDLGFDAVWSTGLGSIALERVLTPLRASADRDSAQARKRTIVAASEQHAKAGQDRVVDSVAPSASQAAMGSPSASIVSCQVLGRSVDLPWECALLLRCLGDVYPAPASRSQLADALSRPVTSEAPLRRRIDMTAYRLRRALREAGESRVHVQPVRNVGYRLVIEDGHRQDALQVPVTNRGSGIRA